MSPRFHRGHRLRQWEAAAHTAAELSVLLPEETASPSLSGALGSSTRGG